MSINANTELNLHFVHKFLHHMLDTIKQELHGHVSIVSKGVCIVEMFQ